MKLVSFLASSLLLLMAQVSTARRHHDALAASNQTLTGRALHNMQDFQIYKPGDKWGFHPPAIATSYVPDKDTSMTGACGWEGINTQMKQGGLIYGAAQMYSVFGEGVSCGTCLRLNATERALYGDVGPFKVVVINSCPGTCHSLDLEVPGIVHWLKRPRVGQLNIVGEVVPCDFKKAGIFIEVYQFTTSKYDVRFNFRGNSGAIAFSEVACHGSKTWFPMHKDNPLNYILDDQKSSPRVLQCNYLDFRLTNFVNEKILLTGIPNKLFQRNAANEWYNTRHNFNET